MTDIDNEIFCTKVKELFATAEKEWDTLKQHNPNAWKCDTLTIQRIYSTFYDAVQALIHGGT